MEIGARMARGAAWMVAWRLLDRSLGLISTIVLARLLLPADFGLVAMAMSLIAIIALLNSFGFETALIQNQQAEKRHYDTAWTFGVIFGVVNTSILLVLAHPASVFYAEPRLENVIYCLAFTSFLSGFINVGIVAFRKELQLEKEFKFQASRRFIMVAITIALAVWFRNYWALVIGSLVSNLLAVVISYLMHPYRPRFSLAGGRDLFSFSKWLLAINLLNFVHNRSVDLILGKMAGARSLGIYSISYEISSLPSTELVAPITRATFPGYAKITQDANVLRQMYLKVTGVIALFTVPAGVGISATSDLIVAIALGPKWETASPIIAVLALSGVIYAIQSNSGASLMALGKLRALTSILALQAAIVVPALVIGTMVAGTFGAAVATLVIAITVAPIAFTVALTAMDLRYRQFFAVIWRPILAAVLMYTVLETVMSPLSSADVAEQIQQAVKMVAVGIIVYSSALLGLWKFSGSPDGAERYLLKKLILGSV